VPRKLMYEWKYNVEPNLGSLAGVNPFGGLRVLGAMEYHGGGRRRRPAACPPSMQPTGWATAGAWRCPSARRRAAGAGWRRPCRGLRYTWPVCSAHLPGFDRATVPGTHIRRVSRRPEGQDVIRDIAILQRTINRLRGGDLVPRGVRRFHSHEEADAWMMRQMASTHARRSSKTS
jgi:hypothetical protein